MQLYPLNKQFVFNYIKFVPVQLQVLLSVSYKENKKYNQLQVNQKSK